jgi:CheY-like chemotaxis protein
MTVVLALLPFALIAWLTLRLAGARRRLGALARDLEDEAARAAVLGAALERAVEGVLVVDASGRALHWDRRFAALSGLPEDLPQEGATLESLLRLSAEAGEFGLVEVEQEVARQLALVAAGPDAFPVLRHRPDGGVVEVNLAQLPGGAVVLRCADVAGRADAPMPVPALPAPAPRDPPALLVGEAPRIPRRLVLLVEDMKVNQLVTATQLRREGHRVDIAGSGAEALRLAAATPYDLVLMDLMMPGMSGYEAAARLRGLPGLAGRVPIFALTANAGEEQRARCREAGMQGMLSKPVPAAALREVLLRGTAPTDDPPAGAGLLDMARLGDLRHDLPAVTLAGLCRACLDDMGPRLDALSAALSAGEPGAIESEAHALAGMAASYGLARIERQCRAILDAIRAGDVAAARRAADGLDEAYDRSRAALLGWVGQGG